MHLCRGACFDAEIIVLKIVIQLYNEEIRDLLLDASYRSNASLTLREDPRSGIFVNGASEKTLTSLHGKQTLLYSSLTIVF